jgi:hypothetical protein
MCSRMAEFSATLRVEMSEKIYDARAMAKSWTPKRNTHMDATTLQLSRVESFVLARVDGTLNADDLADLTGLAKEDVNRALSSLASHGAIESSEPAAPPPSPWVLEAIKSLPHPSSAPPPSQPPPAQTVSTRPTTQASTPPPTSQSLPPPVDETLSEAPEDPAVVDEETSRNHRQIYETQFHPLPRDQRIEAAHTETGARLMALCFDHEPAVVRAVLENPEAGLAHARLIAFHHRNAVGLDMLAAKNELARDTQVQRYLLRNPQLSEALLKRLIMPKRLVMVYKTTGDRDIPEQTRVRARHVLRAKFATAQAEERFELVWTTEGRCLPQLTGCTFDSRTTSLLTAKVYTSTILVQNLARFSACPPILLAHLLKQPFVKRQTHLKQLILQHPNTPGDAKRNA